MNTWIALLKGVNMVGKQKLPMKEFRAMLEELNARDVRTYRGSGNAVFRHRAKNTARLAKRISTAIGKKYGFEPLVMLLETEQLARIIADNPFPEAEAEPEVDWTGSAQKWVPIFSLEQAGVRLGMAQVAGPPEQIAQVKGVYQLRLDFRNIGRVYAYVPVSTISTKLDRVQGVSVWALADIEVLGF